MLEGLPVIILLQKMCGKKTVFCILFSWEAEVPSQMLIKKLNLVFTPKKDEVTYFLKEMVLLYEKNLMIGRFSCHKESFLAENLGSPLFLSVLF